MKESNEKRPTKNLSFGQAVNYLKEGKPVQRAGWNGKGLFIFMQIPAEISLQIVPKMQSLPDSVKEVFKLRQISSTDSIHDYIKYKNQLAMVYPDNTIYGWVASPSDVLENDWELYEV